MSHEDNLEPLDPRAFDDYDFGDRDFGSSIDNANDDDGDEFDIFPEAEDGALLDSREEDGDDQGMESYWIDEEYLVEVREDERECVAQDVEARYPRQRNDNTHRSGYRVQPRSPIYVDNDAEVNEQNYIVLKLARHGRSPRISKPRRREIIRRARQSRDRFNSAEVQRAFDEFDLHEEHRCSI